VYSDVEQVLEHLTDPRFEKVSSVDEAYIMWTKHYLKDFKLVTIRIWLATAFVVFSLLEPAQTIPNPPIRGPMGVEGPIMD